MKKGFIKWLLMSILVVQMVFGSAFSAFAKDEDDVNPSDAVPEIVLLNGPVYEVKAGMVNEVEITIKNASSYTTKNVVVQPTISDTSDNPFKISFKDGSNKFSSIAPRSEKTVTMLVEVDSTAATKTYSMSLKYTFFNSFTNKFSGSDNIYLKVQNVNAEPNFAIENYKVSPENVAAGATATLSATLRNIGPINMNDVNISLDGLDPAGVSIVGVSNKRYNKVDAGTQVDFSFQIVTNSGMDSGSYPVTVHMTYKDDGGKEYTLDQKYYVNVGGSSSGAKPTVEIKNMAEPSGTFGVNSNFSVKFDLFNNGKATAKNIKITATPAGGEDAVVPKSASIQTLNELAAGGSKSFEFVFAATAASKSQNYPIEFSVEYEDGTKKEGVNNVITFKQYAGVNVSNPEGDAVGPDGKKVTSKPKIIVSNYVCDPIIVMAGEEFDLTMTFLNTHPEKNVKNVKMFLTLSEETSSDTEKTGNIFTPVDSSNTFYFDAIPSKGTVNKKLRLYTVPDAQPKTYTLTVNFEYEDESGNEYTATELLGINVAQPTKLETSQIALPTSVEAGMPVNLSFELYNTGKVTLNNLMIKLEGDIDTQNKSTYLGNFESGNNEYFDGTFMIYNEGETTVSVILSYDDPSGEHIENKQDFTIMVTAPAPMEEMDPSMMDPGMNGGANTGILKKIGIGVGVVIVVAVIGGIVWKKRKAKKEEEFLKAEDEEDKNFKG